MLDRPSYCLFLVLPVEPVAQRSSFLACQRDHSWHAIRRVIVGGFGLYSILKVFFVLLLLFVVPQSFRRSTALYRTLHGMLTTTGTRASHHPSRVVVLRVPITIIVALAAAGVVYQGVVVTTAVFERWRIAPSSSSSSSSSLSGSSLWRRRAINKECFFQAARITSEKRGCRRHVADLMDGCKQGKFTKEFVRIVLSVIKVGKRIVANGGNNSSVLLLDGWITRSRSSRMIRQEGREKNESFLAALRSWCGDDDAGVECQSCDEKAYFVSAAIAICAPTELSSARRDSHELSTYQRSTDRTK
eukprot:scaffold1825_cov181-Amphora_coffeaeformis.AAC.3